MTSSHGGFICGKVTICNLFDPITGESEVTWIGSLNSIRNRDEDYDVVVMSEKGSFDIVGQIGLLG